MAQHTILHTLFQTIFCARIIPNAPQLKNHTTITETIFLRPQIHTDMLHTFWCNLCYGAM